MKRILSTLAGLAIAASASAQISLNPGDFVLATSQGVHSVDRSSGTLQTLALNDGFDTYQWASVERDNTNVIALRSGFTKADLHRINVPSGIIGTVGNLPTTALGAAMDHNGKWVIGGGSRELYHLAGTNTFSTARKITNLPIAAADVCVDDDTGDYYVVERLIQPADIIHVSRSGLRVTTIAQGVTNMHSIDHDQLTGRLFVAKQSAPGVVVLNRNGTLTPFGSSGPATALHVDDTTGHVFVASAGVITEYDPTGKAVGAFGPFGSLGIRSIAIYGTRKIVPTSIDFVREGVVYNVNGRFTQTPNRPYACGLGISGLRPGITIAGRTINIAPDALLVASVSGHLFPFATNFVGTTDSRGRFTASFILPPLPASAPPLVFNAAVVDPAAPGGLDFGPSQAVAVR